MNEQQTPMDALDRRLTTYLQGRAEMAAALGPGPDEVAAAIAGGTRRAAPRIGPGSTSWRGVPAFAWMLLLVGALAALAVAVTAGGNRDEGLVLVPPSSAGPEILGPGPSNTGSPLRGWWVLDFAASGIDDTYGGPDRTPDAVPLTFGSSVWFGPGGALAVSSGAGGGCWTDGTWEATGTRVALALPTGQSGCELVGPGPAARQIRERLVAAAAFELDGSRLTFFGADGRPALVYRWPVNAAGDPVPRPWELGTLQLDFAASGIDPSVTVDGGPSSVTSSITFDDAGRLVVVSRVLVDQACDEANGTYDDRLEFTISIPTLSGSCGDGPIHPDLEVRRRLARVAGYDIAGDGSYRLLERNGNVLLVYRQRSMAPAPSGSPASIEGAWWLDFAASGIDDTYGGPGAMEGIRLESGVAFEAGERFRVSTGTLAGCDATGTWSVGDGTLGISVLTGSDPCEDAGPGPAAREIRQRLARAARFAREGSRLTLLDAAGSPLLVFDRSTDGSLWRSFGAPYEGAWRLDFEASGIEGSYTLTSGPKRQTIPVGSSIELGGGVISGGTGAGGGCDAFEGTYEDAGGRFAIDLPSAPGRCGRGPVYPDLEVREHLELTAAWEVEGDVLRLLDAEGAVLLVYRRVP